MSAIHSITSLQHPLVKHLVKLRNDPTYRYLHQAILMEGVKPIQEISQNIRKLFFTPEYFSSIHSMQGEKWQVTHSILQKISGLTTPEGIVAEMQMPPFVSIERANKILALDAVNDPGNLGTLLRTGLALGWDTVYFLPGCCDLYNEKVIRSARGAHFKLKLSKGTGEELQEFVMHKGFQALVAELQGQSPQAIQFASKRLLVLGNEAHGASQVISHFCQPITIPMPGKMESLNVAVAGGILLYLLSTSNERNLL